VSRFYEPSEWEALCWELADRDAERERTMMELVAAIGPRPSVASVLRGLRLRRGRR
jgi:hypothetical protein